MALRCVIIDDDPIQRELVSSYIGEHDGTELVTSFDSAISAVNFFDSNDIDVLFLDVELPGMSGLEFLRSSSSASHVILISSEMKYAVDSFEFEVTDYLLKPISFARFLQAVQKVNRIMAEQNTIKTEKDVLFVKANSVIEKITLTDITHIEAAVDYVMIYTGNRKFMVNSSMNAIMNKLPGNDFMRIHRSYIVRIDKIESVDGSTVVVNNKVLRVSKGYRQEFLDRLDVI